MAIVVATVSAYKSALQKLEAGLHEKHLELLRAHYNFPSHVATAKELAKAVGYKSYRAVNAQYGTLGKKIGRAFGSSYKGAKDISVIVDFVAPRTVSNKEWLLVMRPELVIALEELGWVEKRK